MRSSALLHYLVKYKFSKITTVSICKNVSSEAIFTNFFTATCFSNVAVMGSLDVRPSVCLSVRDVGEQ